MEQEFYNYFLTWLWNISPHRLHEIVEYFGSPQALYDAREHELKALEARERSMIQQWKQSEDLYQFWEKRHQESCQFISCEDSNYPAQLLELPDYPYGIYVEGRLPEHEPIVAMVGARNCTEYGRTLAYRIARELGYHKIAVVSGLAGGIDGASHRGCIDGGGYTLGILGSGIHTVYPKENYDLYIQMKKHGGILSEYPPDLKPMPYLFPRRNRMISIFADFVLVVEARKKSGSLITVDFALEQGKDIGVIPGRPCDSLSAGCNHMLQQGAKCILSAEDILDEIRGLQTRSGETENDAGLKVDRMNWDLVLAPKEKKVYSCLRLEPMFIDDILCQLDIPIGEGIQILTELEIKGVIKQNPHQFYSRLME